MKITIESIQNGYIVTKSLDTLSDFYRVFYSGKQEDRMVFKTMDEIIAWLHLLKDKESGIENNTE